MCEHNSYYTDSKITFSGNTYATCTSCGKVVRLDRTLRSAFYAEYDLEIVEASERETKRYHRGGEIGIFDF